MDLINKCEYPVSVGVKNIVDSLIRQGSDVNYVANDGNSAAILAAIKGNSKNLQKEFHKFYYYYHFLGNKEIMSILLRNGANIHHTNREGYSPLIYAAKKGRTNIVKFLLENGARDTAGNDGNTGLIFAAVAGNLIIK